METGFSTQWIAEDYNWSLFCGLQLMEAWNNLFPLPRLINDVYPKWGVAISLESEQTIASIWVYVPHVVEYSDG